MQKNQTLCIDYTLPGITVCAMIFAHKFYRHSMKITMELSVPEAVIRMANCLDRLGSPSKHFLTVIVLFICKLTASVV